MQARARLVHETCPWSRALRGGGSCSGGVGIRRSTAIGSIGLLKAIRDFDFPMMYVFQPMRSRNNRRNQTAAAPHFTAAHRPFFTQARFGSYCSERRPKPAAGPDSHRERNSRLFESACGRNSGGLRCRAARHLITSRNLTRPGRFTRIGGLYFHNARSGAFYAETGFG